MNSVVMVAVVVGQPAWPQRSLEGNQATVSRRACATACIVVRGRPNATQRQKPPSLRWSDPLRVQIST